MKKISIGVISYNGKYRVEHCIRSIYEMTDPSIDYEVIMVDDGSPHQEYRNNMFDLHNKYSDHSKGSYFIQHAENEGITRSWNDIVKAADSDIVVMLNDDILVTKNWLKAGLYFMENNSEAGMVGFPTFFCKRDEMHSFFEGAKGYLKPRSPHGGKPQIPTEEVDLALSPKEYNRTPGRCACPVGCCFMFRKSEWAKIKYKDGSVGFPEWLKSLYEDFTFGFEMMKQGKRNYMLRFPYLYHCLGNTFGNNPELTKGGLLQNSQKAFVNYYGGDTEVMDKYYEENKKSEIDIKVKYLDSNLAEREEGEEK